MRKVALPLLLSAALAGCSLEPHYQRPAPPVPPSWPVGDAYLRQSEAALPSVSYRDIFRDPKLQAIIEEALANNRNLRIAAANIASTLAQYHVQRSQLFPQVGAEANAGITGAHNPPTATIVSNGTGSTGTGGTGTGGTGTGTGGTGSGGTTNFSVVTTPGGFGTSQNYSVDIGVTSWELDLFGRVRSLSHSALDQYFATEAAARATRLTMVGQIATTYFQLAADNSLLTIAKNTAANAQRAVTLTNARLVGGVSSRIDLREAQTVLDQARSDVASQTTLVAQDRNALQLLVGAPIPDNLIPPSIESVDALVSELPAGLSSTVLLRRPDVVEAEYQLRAANARIGAARAAFFPTISLTGLLGLASSTLTGLFSVNAFNFHAGANASVPIFDGGANRGNLAFARAQQQLFLAQYEQTIQTAFREVSDALARRGTIEAQMAAQSDLVAHSRDAYNLNVQRYQIGIDEFLNTLVAQRTLYTSEQSLIRTRLDRATNLSNLYQTLGGDALIEAGAGQNQAPTPLAPAPPASPTP
jgi:multidrug efflux system outer membrane protein